MYALENRATLRNPQADEDNIYYDIHSGKGYQEMVHPGQIGMLFNTDGISPFKSSRLTVWPCIYQSATKCTN